MLPEINISGSTIINRELHALNKGQIASAIRHKILIIEKSGVKLFRLLQAAT